MQGFAINAVVLGGLWVAVVFIIGLKKEQQRKRSRQDNKDLLKTKLGLISKNNFDRMKSEELDRLRLERGVIGIHEYMLRKYRRNILFAANYPDQHELAHIKDLGFDRLLEEKEWPEAIKVVQKMDRRCR